MTSPNWPKQFRAAASTFDWPALAQLAAEYATHLYAVPKLPDSVGQVLLVLRQSRRYEELELVADAALAHGPDAPAVRRHYAQALVDSGNLAVALRLYTELAADETAPRGDRIEARGGIGRCYKEMFLACTEPDRRRRFLSRSLRGLPGRVSGGHGLLHLARDQRRCPPGPRRARRHPAPVGIAEGRRTGRRHPADRRLGPRAEHVDRGDGLRGGDRTRPVRRGRRTGRGVHRDDAGEVRRSRRSSASSRRSGSSTPPPRPVTICSPCCGPRCSRSTGAGSRWRPATSAPHDSPTSSDGGRLEAILGADRYLSLTWYRTGLKRCRAVARIQTADDLGVGTGFLVAGPDLHPDLPPLVVVTNGHVVPEDLDPGHAHVAFHGLDDDQGRQGRFRVARQWWYQPSADRGLDTTILELDGYPQDVVPTPLAKGLPPRPLSHRRAYVIGHPGGSAQPQFSLQDNILLDYDHRVLHYRSPTEGGSSGSPVSDDEWRLIGLHHAGGTGMPQLNKAGGTYAANEGITIDAIRGGLAHRPPECSPL